jgi:hypothetical protein
MVVGSRETRGHGGVGCAWHGMHPILHMLKFLRPSTAGQRCWAANVAVRRCARAAADVVSQLASCEPELPCYVGLQTEEVRREFSGSTCGARNRGAALGLGVRVLLVDGRVWWRSRRLVLPSLQRSAAQCGAYPTHSLWSLAPAAAAGHSRHMSCLRLPRTRPRALAVRRRCRCASHGTLPHRM